MTPSVKAFPFEAGLPAKVTVCRVNKLVSTLNEAGYGCALSNREFVDGKFIITVDRESGYTVAWKKLGGLREVAA